MRAITRGVDPNALRSLLGFPALTPGVATATEQAWEAPEGRFGSRLVGANLAAAASTADLVMGLRGVSRRDALPVSVKQMLTKPAWRVVCASRRAISVSPLSRCLAAP